MQVTGNAGGPWTVTSLQNPLFLTANALTGGTTPSVAIAVTGYNLNLGNNNSLGNGTWHREPGHRLRPVRLWRRFHVSNPLTFNNSFVNIGGNNNLTFAGPITLSDTGTGPNTFTNTLNITSTGLTTFAGSITGAGSLLLTGSGYGYLSQTGAATVAFTGAQPAPTRATPILNGPTVIAGSNNAFGTGTLTLTSGTLLAGSAGASLGNSNVVLNGSLTVPVVFGGSSIGSTASTTSTSSTSSLTFSGATTLATPTFVQVMNNTTFSNTVTGPGGLVVAGPGNLSLLGANTYYGGTVLNSAGGGVVSSFYNGNATGDTNAINFNATPTATRIDPDINYPDVSASFQGPATPGNPATLPPGVTLVTVGMVVNGYLNIVTPGAYTFGAFSDDGFTMLIDGIVVINNDNTANGAVLVTGAAAVTLSAGLHTLQVRYVNNGAGGANVIEYSGPDTNNVSVVIPTSALASSAGVAGTLTVGTGTSLGNGFVSLSNGVLSANNASGVTIANAVTLAGGPLPVALAGNAITFSSRFPGGQRRAVGQQHNHAHQ